MKRWHTVLFIIFIVVGSLHALSGQEYRIYNDGIIDYVPISASFVLSAEDDESSLMEIQYSIDGSPLRIYNSPITFSEEGRHIIVYRALDKTENISSEKIYPVIVDATPPEGFVSVDGPVFIKDRKFYVTRNSSIILWVEDNLSGVDAVYVALDNSGYTKYTGPVTISAEGFHTVKAYAVDNVGNRTSTYIVEGYVDSTPPEVTITPRYDFISGGGDNYTNKENEYRVTAYDRIAGTSEILISLDGSEYATYTGSFKIQIPGFHSLKAKAVDNLGNESYPVELTFYVDTTPPKATMGVTVED